MNDYRLKYAIAELICYLIYSLFALWLFYRSPGWFGLASTSLGMFGMASYTSKVLKILSFL